MKKTRFGIVGTGRISDWVLKGAVLEPRFEAAAVCSRSQESGKRFAEAHNIGKVYTDIKKRGDVVLARRCVEKVARKRRVENEALDGKVVFEQRALEVFYVVADLFDVRRKERAQERVPVALIAVEVKLSGEGGMFARIAVDDYA